MLELAVYSPSPLVTSAFAAGILVAGIGVVRILRVKTRGRLCPQCGSTTVSLVPSFPLSLLGGRVLSRWCSGCDWSGLTFRPSHERRASDGRVHLRGGFKWGSPPPPPTQFFSWQGEENAPKESPGPANLDPKSNPAPTGPPPFQWKEDTRPPAQGGAPPPLPFHFSGEAPPPLPFRFSGGTPAPKGFRGPGSQPPPLPFVFAEEEEEEDQGGFPLEEEPPRIPFRFAGDGEVGGRSPDPSRIRPRLGFRWRA